MALDLASMGDALKETTNPLDLSASQWLGGWALRFGAVFVYDLLLEGVTKRCFKKMPSRLAGMASGVEVRTFDKMMLGMNSFIEVMFIYNLLWVLFLSPDLTYGTTTLGVLNTVVASFALFVIDDLLYNLAHRFLHWRPIYPYIHKIHHRQYLPIRGYVDAAIEHPIEQVIGLGIFWISLRAVIWTTGMHISAFLFSFLFYSFFNVVNHLPYDVQFQFLGFQYSTRAHEMHHRFPGCNFSKSCMYWDHIFGTFKPYSIPKSREEMLKAQ